MAFSLSRTTDERVWKIDIERLLSFSWANASNTMTIVYHENLDLQKLSFWLLHTVLPIYLMLKQSSMMFHAASVEVAKKAILLIAPSFGGKSTLADFLLSQGHRLLSDDKVRVEQKEENYYVYPSYPYRRPYREFEALGTYAEDYVKSCLPVSGIYVLNYIRANSRCSIETVRGLDKFEILKNSHLYEPVSMSQKEMMSLVAFVRHCSLYRLNIPKDIRRLAEVHQVILENERDRGSQG